MDTRPFVDSFSHEDHLGCFHLLIIINNAPINICIQSFCVDMFSFLLDIYQGVILLGHVLTLRLIIGGTARLFFKEVEPFYITPVAIISSHA